MCVVKEAQFKLHVVMRETEKLKMFKKSLNCSLCTEFPVNSTHCGECRNREMTFLLKFVVSSSFVFDGELDKNKISCREINIKKDKSTK